MGIYRPITSIYSFVSKCFISGVLERFAFVIYQKQFCIPLKQLHVRISPLGVVKVRNNIA